MELVRVEELPHAPLDAAAAFYARWVPMLDPSRPSTGSGREDLLLVFPPAAHNHRAWRLAVVQELARSAAPRRINGVAADSKAALASALAYLDRAPGVTGQYWALDAAGAESA